MNAAIRAVVRTAVFHDMEGGWHRPEFNNTRVGSHAYSADGGRSWVSTGVAFVTQSYVHWYLKKRKEDEETPPDRNAQMRGVVPTVAGVLFG